MSLKAEIFVATSLDGYIARSDGGIDWLIEANTILPKGEDCGYHDFFEAVDLLVMGKNTFEVVSSFGKCPYGDKPVIVMTGTGVTVPDELRETVTTSSETPWELYNRLKSEMGEGPDRIYIDGGNTILRFLEDGLIDRMTITVIPIILGGGVPLFGPLEGDIRLSHISTKAYDFGFVQSTYEIIK